MAILVARLISGDNGFCGAASDTFAGAFSINQVSESSVSLERIGPGFVPPEGMMIAIKDYSMMGKFDEEPFDYQREGYFTLPA
jgi:hypothetical protein